jgi:predicted AAA+ superfamily ATPase
MLTLVDRAFRHMGGNAAGSSVFLLSQAMGGGKTHSMIALGLLAQDPDLRRKVLGDGDPAPKLKKCKVVGFNGRSTDAPGGIWGSLAEQLGKADQFARYCSPLLQAPGPEAWKQLSDIVDKKIESEEKSFPSPSGTGCQLKENHSPPVAKC